MKNKVKNFCCGSLVFAKAYLPTLIVPFCIAIILVFNNYYANVIINAEYFENNNFDSLGYTLIIFILGIIITLKIKILDHKEPYKPIFINMARNIFNKKSCERSNMSFRKNEFIAFSVFTFLNVIYLASAYFSSCLDDKKMVISILLVFISFDFVVLVRNVFILGKIYIDEIFKNTKIEDSFETLKIDKDRVEAEMHSLEKIIKYKFYNIELLEKAMYAKKIGKGNNDEHANNAMATFGDSILKAILSQELFENGMNRGEITSKKSNLENNSVLYRIVNDKDSYIIDYAFHDTKFFKDNPNAEELVSNSEHSQYLEAIVAAIYYDSSYERTKLWVNEWLVPKMMNHIESKEN